MLLVSQWGDELLKQTEELRRHMREKDDRLVKLEEERTPVKQAARENLLILDVISEVSHLAIGAGKCPGSEMTDLSQ